MFSANPESFEELKSAGFNSIQSYVSDFKMSGHILDEAARTGLRALIKIPQTKFPALLQWFIKKAGTSPTLLGWYLADEPEGKGISPLNIRKQTE